MVGVSDRGHGAQEAGHGSHREVDLAGHDHEDHAHGQDRRDRHLPRQEREVARG